MKRIHLLLPAAILCAAAVSCSEKPADNNGGKTDEPEDIEVIPVAPTVPSDISSIYELNNGNSSENSCSDTWKNSSLELSTTANLPASEKVVAVIPHKLPDGNLLIVAESESSNGYTIQSVNGRSVGELSAGWNSIGRISGPSSAPALSLVNFGENSIMLALAGDRTISAIFSEDNGKNWSAIPKNVVTMEDGFTLGTKISAVNNNGTLQIYYSTINNAKVSDSGVCDETVRMSSSSDGGATWTGPYDVAGMAVGTDADGNAVYAEGNPGAMVLNGGRGVTVAMNTNNDGSSISFAFDETGKWAGSVSSGAVKFPIDRSDCLFSNAANPQMCQFLSGETILGYIEDGKDIVLRTGNSLGRNFEVGPENRQFNTMFNVNQTSDGTAGQTSGETATHPEFGIAAVSSHSLAVASTDGVAEYILNHKINASNFTPAIDGNNGDWKDVTEAMFLKSGNAQLCVRFAYSDDWFFVLAERLDDDVDSNDSVEFIFQQGDGTGEPFSVKLTPDLEKGVLTCQNKAVGLRSNINRNIEGKRNGYIAEFGIHRSLLRPIDGRILFNAFMKDNGSPAGSTSGSAGTETCFNGLTRTNYTKWLPIDLKEFVQPEPEPVPDTSEIFNEGPSWSTGGTVNPW